MDLCQAESIRPVDDDGIGGRHVDSAFDDGGADEHIETPMIKVEHELFQIALAHLTVAYRDIRLGNEFANGLRGFFNGLDGVVDEVDLAAAPNFAQARFADHRVIPFQHESLHGQPLRGRRRNQR